MITPEWQTSTTIEVPEEMRAYCEEVVRRSIEHMKRMRDDPPKDWVSILPLEANE